MHLVLNDQENVPVLQMESDAFPGIEGDHVLL